MQTVQEQCTELLQFPHDSLEEFFNLPPIATPQGESVPVAYIRQRLRELNLRPEIAPDYTIVVTDHGEPVGEYLMHKTVWASQCAMVLPIVQGTSKRTVEVEAPTPEALETFIAWLYTNDEQSLYDNLVAGNATSATFLRSFCQLVRSSICVNHKINGVVTAVFEGDGAADDANEEEKEEEEGGGG